MAWRCYISNFRSLRCQKAHQEGPYPPSPGWILGGQMVPDALPGGSWWPGGATFQISNLIIILLKLSFIPVSYSSLRKVLWVDGTGGYTTGTCCYTNIAKI